MKTILNRIGAIRVTPARFFGFWAILFALVFSLCSCSDDLDVQQSYPFTVDVMPYPDKISNGETVELRMTILPEGNYANTLYTIRYFQYEGKGTLKLVDGPTLVNNDRVLLESKEFRLNYTAKSADSQEIYICIEDNYGTRWEQTFEFNNSDGDGGSGSLVVTPINPGTITPINY
ncbi:DUF3872 domain-containing protein [uncultured Duncaniella sp.]|uniref:DUF3872 domain-containing protein n=1 Tax=uncultured Duncaniella sp. TaxID=2768039 RepID=UPI000B011C2D|nr:DUF3872 domain-containing protein [uncultured Duncaniella sp.]